MKRFFGKFVALPFRFFAELGGVVRVFDVTSLRKIIWKLTGSSDDCCAAILGMCKNGPTEQARQIARKTMVQTKDCGPAAMMGLMELQHNQDLEAARWIEMAEEIGCENLEMLLYLKFVIGARAGQMDERVIDEIILRNDLPGYYSQAALLGKAGMFAERKQWGQAEEIADKILLIEEQANARIIKRMCCEARE